MSSPPECGPAAVVNAPVTTTANVTGTRPSASHRSDGATVPVGAPRANRSAPSETTTARPTAAIARKKWLITSQGFRWKITVSPPRGTWATIATAVNADPSRIHRGSPATRRAKTAATIVVIIVRNATTRLPNSTYEWKPVSAVGNGLSPQRGQLSQPSPDAVTRTTAPVTTTTKSEARAAYASMRNVSGETQRRRARRAAARSSALTGGRPPHPPRPRRPGPRSRRPFSPSPPRRRYALRAG